MPTRCRTRKSAAAPASTRGQLWDRTLTPPMWKSIPAVATSTVSAIVAASSQSSRTLNPMDAVESRCSDNLRQRIRKPTMKRFASTTVILALATAALIAQAPPPPTPVFTEKSAGNGPLDRLYFRAIGPATPSGRVDDFAVLESDP